MDKRTRAENANHHGKRRAVSEILAVIYNEFCKVMVPRLTPESPGRMLEPTAQVREASGRIVDGRKNGAMPISDPVWDNRRESSDAVSALEQSWWYTPP
jgi:hypothetical protein